MYIDGVYLDGKTSKRVGARLEVLSDINRTVFIHIISSAGEEHAHEKIERLLSDIKIESRLGRAPREISFGDGQLFITEDSDAVDEILDVQGQSISSSSLHRLETNASFILFALVVTILFVWGVVGYGIPQSAKFIAFQLPDFSSEKFGGSLAILDESYFNPSELTVSRQQEIRALVAPYLTTYETLNPKLVFRSGLRANAFALPDGSIVLTDDLVNLVEKNEELLAVFFHEIGHLKYKHIARRTLQDSMVTLLTILIIGDVDTINLVVGLPVLMMDLSYSREFEKEADDFALEQMDRFGIPVDHFATIMQRLEGFYPHKNDGAEIETPKQEKSISNFFSTHPTTKERIKLVDQFKTDHP